MTDETNPQDWRMPVPVRLIDVAADARRLYGPDMFRDLPEHDYRFELALPGGATIRLHAGATAAHVVAYLAREGVDFPGCEPSSSLPTERS